jgi:hypothetical protein
MKLIILCNREIPSENAIIFFFLEKGELKAQGSFNELIKINKKFSSMAKNY